MTANEIDKIIREEKKLSTTRVRLTLEENSEYIDWLIRQFILGEQTGVLEGKAMQKAPGLNEAEFLARQIIDEINHTRIYQKQLTRIRAEHPGSDRLKIPGFLKGLVKPISGRLWQEHCFLDKAIGEHWVLKTMIFLEKNLTDKRLVQVLKTISGDEVTHIQFGEKEVQKAIDEKPSRKKYLLGLYFRNDIAMAFFSRILTRFFESEKRNDLAMAVTDFFKGARQQMHQKAGTLLQVEIKNVSTKSRLFLALRAQLRMLFNLMFKNRFKGIPLE